MTPYYMPPPLINIPARNEWQANPNNPDDWIYNQEVGWREKTWGERHSVKNEFLNPIIGEKILRPAANISATVVKYGLYLAGGLGLAWAASSVALSIYDGVERLVT